MSHESIGGQVDMDDKSCESFPSNRSDWKHSNHHKIESFLFFLKKKITQLFSPPYNAELPPVWLDSVLWAIKYLLLEHHERQEQRAKKYNSA